MSGEGNMSSRTDRSSQSGACESAVPGDAGGSWAPWRKQRVFTYCHDSVGVGHLHRTLAICESVGREHPDSTFLLATGTPYVPLFRQVPRVDYIKLPALSKVDNQTYRGKFLTVSPDRIMRCREALLLQTMQHFDPSIVLIDKAPLGVCRELVPSLRWLRENRPHTRIVFGMRDIEDEREATIAQWARAGVCEVLEECFDEIWVYGMENLYDVATEYGLSERIRKKLHFIGYIAPKGCESPCRPDDTPDDVLVTVGGGTDGETLLRPYVKNAAARVAAMGLRSTIVTGPDMPKSVVADLKSLAGDTPDIEWLRFEPCMHCRIDRARLVVSMGGYNTLCQIARNRTPALVLPRTKPRLEQAIRARLWSDRGAVQMVDPETLTPAALGDAVVRQLESGPRSTSPDLDLNGLSRVCERFAAHWQLENRHAAPVSL